MKHLILSLLAILMVSCAGQQSKEKTNYQFIADLENARLGALMGSAEEAYLEKRFPNKSVDRYETLTDLVQALKQNRVDAIGMDGYCTPYLNLVLGGGLVALDDSMGTMEICAAFPKGEQGALREQFNQFLKEIKESGEHAKIFDKWINHSETAVMPDLKLPTKGEIIKVATCPTLPPTSFLQDNKSAGMDMEILQLFAIYVNRPIKVENLNFSSLVTSLCTHKVDMVVSSLIKTEERAKMVDFSNSYIDFNLDVLVRAEDKVGYVAGPTQEKMTENKGLIGMVTHWIDGLKESFESNLIKEKRYEMVLKGLKITLIISFFSAIFGTLLGCLVCFLRMRKSIFLRSIALAYVNVMRGMPLLVLLLIMFYVVFNRSDISPVTVAVITFSMNFGAYTSEMFRTSIEGIDRGQTEAGIALGFSKFRTFTLIILPQAFKQVLPVYKGEMISMVKMTSIVGYIAVEDLTKVSDIIRSRTFDALFPLVMVALLYFLIAWLFALVLDLIGRKYN